MLRPLRILFHRADFQPALQPERLRYRRPLQIRSRPDSCNARSPAANRGTPAREPAQSDPIPATFGTQPKTGGNNQIERFQLLTILQWQMLLSEINSPFLSLFGFLAKNKCGRNLAVVFSRIYSNYSAAITTSSGKVAKCYRNYYKMALISAFLSPIL